MARGAHLFCPVDPTHFAEERESERERVREGGREREREGGREGGMKRTRKGMPPILDNGISLFPLSSTLGKAQI